MAKILAFDTATAACSAALSIDGEITEEFELAPRRHGELLLPMIDRLLKDAKLSITACDAIAFGNGPGSFMGLRIAAGLAQGLAFASAIPVIPVPTLQALAQMAFWQTGQKKLLAGWDARMQQIYWGVYVEKQGMMQSLIADQLSDPGSIEPVEDCMGIGNAWSIYTEHLPKSIVFSDQEFYPHAKATAFLAQNLWAAGKAIAPDAIELSYLRNNVASKPASLRK